MFLLFWDCNINTFLHSLSSASNLPIYFFFLIFFKFIASFFTSYFTHMKIHKLICIPKYNQVVHIWLYCYLNLYLWLIFWDWATKMYSSFWKKRKKKRLSTTVPQLFLKVENPWAFSYPLLHLHWYHPYSNGKFKFLSSSKFIVFYLICFESVIHTYNVLL